MKKLVCAALTGLWVASATAGNGMLLWDNYLSQPNGYDGVNALTSERKTLVQRSWTVDDVIFDNPVQLDAIRWLAVRQPMSSSINYPAADILVMNESFVPVVTLTDVAFSATVRGNLGNLQAYEGQVDFPASTVLPAGRYFVGARLVGNDLGRNFMLTTGNGAMNGDSFGYHQAESFAVNQWVPVGQVNGISNTEFAYQVYGTIVPEPTTMILLGVGAILLRRR